MAGRRACHGVALVPGYLSSASIASTFARRRTWRSSPENNAARKARAHSTAGSTPITSPPRQSTLRSSCSTPWCAEYVSWETAARTPRTLLGRDGRADPRAADEDPAVGLAVPDRVGQPAGEVGVVVGRVGLRRRRGRSARGRCRPAGGGARPRSSTPGVIRRQRDPHQACPPGRGAGTGSGTRPRSPSRTTPRPTSATRSTVKPNCSRIVGPGADRPEAVERDDRALVAGPALPAERDPHLHADTLPDRRRQHRLAVGRSPGPRTLPARQRDDARRDAVGLERFRGSHGELELGAGGDQHQGGQPASGLGATRHAARSRRGGRRPGRAWPWPRTSSASGGSGRGRSGRPRARRPAPRPPRPRSRRPAG